ncbi:ribbon-helix-helix protein, CopG family [Candidatus Bathyarchaeota archaeon]|nr:MAG: ribbon-helix-helix protein, CopG family [Candidatus Bathyarchaeota archaeon]TMI35595.1 MAG: ribbon-helix-helix protein, CopG family [Candidatus Bathyarchaeota archaeon]
MSIAKTTIQVDEDIARLLEHLKRERALKSYSDALREILSESKTLKRSERGSLPRLKPFSREKIDRFD